MATINELLNNNNSLTITLASLANTSARQSTAIDNTTNQDLDAGVMVKIKTAAASTSATGYVNVYAFGSADGGTTYTEGAGATDAAITLTSPPNVRLIGRINAVANATTYIAGPFSAAAAFGYLPGKWGIIVENQTGATLDSTAGNFAAIYERIRGTSA